MRNSIKKPLFRIFDLFSAPFVFVCLPLLKIIRKYGVDNFPINLRSFLYIGVFPVRDHYYEPQISYSKDFDAKKVRKLKIDFNLPGQITSLQQLKYTEELGQFVKEGIPSGDSFYINNPAFGPGDSELYYLLVRNCKPKRIIEIGSGYSTLVCLEALTDEARQAPTRFFVRCTHRDVKFIIAHFADDIPLLSRNTVFAARSSVQEPNFATGMIKKAGPPQLHTLF